MKKTESLAKLFSPESYKLTILAHSGDTAAEGLIIITGRKLRAPSRRLVFHQKDLKITSAKVTAHTKAGDKEIAVERINHHGSFEQVRLHTKETLYPGSYLVTMAFTVKPPALEEPDVISAAYKAKESTKHFFPCIDEASAKDIPLEVTYEGKPA
ncbi:MAG: hypothetical protein WD877_02185 [Candidatus Saccharimonadales bacterium]